MSLRQLLPFQKARTSSRGTSFENWLLLTVLFETMRTKLVRIAVKLDTANTIAQNSATSLPTSSAEFVAMLVTWREIVQIDREEQMRETVRQQASLKDVLDLQMLSTRKWRTSCKNSLAMVVVLLLATSNLVRAATILLATVLPKTPGIVQLQAPQAPQAPLPGNKIAEIVVVTTLALLLLLGNRPEVMTDTTAMVRREVLLHGKLELHLHLHSKTTMEAINSKGMVRMAMISHLHLLQQAFPTSCSNMGKVLLPLHHQILMLHHLLHQATRLLHHLQPRMLQKGTGRSVGPVMYTHRLQR